MKNKKKWIKGIGIVVVTVLLILVGIGVYLLWELHDYVSSVPKITPRQSLETRTERIVFIEDMFHITCDCPYEAKLSIIETDISDAEIVNDGQQLYAGSQPGTIRVGITATGDVAEYSSAETVIVVKEGE